MTYGGTDGGAVAVASIVVARVKLVAHKGCPPTAKVLDSLQILAFDYLAGGVTGVRSEDYPCASGDFVGNLLRVDMVTVLLRERNWNCGEL